MGITESAPTYEYQDVKDTELEYSPKEKEQLEHILKYDFEFENIVLEGGGVKGVAYCGAIRMLERTGIWPKIKRIGGTSAGSITAALLAVGYDSYDLQKFLSMNLEEIFKDASWGRLSMLPNLVRRFGWHPADKLYDWLGDVINEKTGNPDTTFMQIYKQKEYPRELCIVVCNVNQMTTMYCHPKTTPDMPIRYAVRMSSSIPIMFQAMKYKWFSQLDYYVDGGLICNYPIHCFDGWYLSMDLKDSFIQKLCAINDASRLWNKAERFGTFNEKTLGFFLYSADEPDVMQTELEKREKDMDPPVLPDTHLAKKWLKENEEKKAAAESAAKSSEPAKRFLDILLKNCNTKESKDHHVDYDELEAAVEQMADSDLEILFGKSKAAAEIFRVLDIDTDKKISFNELVHFLERNNVFMMDQFLGFKRVEINSITEFANAIQDTLVLNAKQKFVSAKKDIDRTIGINNLYLSYADFVTEKGDRELQVQQGRKATIAYLYQYAQKNKPPLKSKK